MEQIAQTGPKRRKLEALATQLSPEERTKLIFEMYAPVKPILSREVLAEETPSPEENMQSRERQRESEPQPPRQPLGGHWETRRIPGSFGRPLVQRVWVPECPDNDFEGG
jgi:hypothetical protein